QVAAHLGTDHTEFYVEPRHALDVIPHLADWFGEPFADPSQIPTYLVSELTRRHVTVALCGDGGDELFAGYNRYVFGARILPRVDRVPHRVRRLLAAGVARVRLGADGLLGAGVARLSSEALNRLGPRLGERMHKVSDLMTAESVGEMYRSLLSAWKQPERVLMGAYPDQALDDDDSPTFEEGESVSLLDRM